MLKSTWKLMENIKCFAVFMYFQGTALISTPTSNAGKWRDHYLRYDSPNPQKLAANFLGLEE